MNTDILLTTETVAPHIGKPNQASVRQQLHRNPSALPPFIKIGGRIFWRMSDVQAWLDAQAEKSKAVQS